MLKLNCVKNLMVFDKLSPLKVSQRKNPFLSYKLLKRILFHIIIITAFKKKKKKKEKKLSRYGMLTKSVTSPKLLSSRPASNVKCPTSSTTDSVGGCTSHFRVADQQHQQNQSCCGHCTDSSLGHFFFSLYQKLKSFS